MVDFGATLKETVVVASGLNIEAAKERFSKYIKIIDNMKAQADELKVENDATNQRAVSLGTSAKKLLKDIEAKRKEIIQEPNDYVKSVNSFCKIFSDKLKAIESSMKSKISRYRTIQEQKRREAELAAKKAADDLQKKLDEEAKEKGFEPVKVETPVIPKEQTPVRTETGSAHGRKNWTFELMNIDEVPREYLTLNEKKVRDAISMGLRNIPGIKIFQEDKTTFRT